MTRSGKMIIAVGLVASGAAIAAGVVWLRHQGLDRAGQWVTVAGFFVSTALGLAGLVVGWLTFRLASKPASVPASSSQQAGEVAVHMRAKASGHGRVYQAGRDQHIHDR